MPQPPDESQADEASSEATTEGTSHRIIEAVRNNKRPLLYSLLFFALGMGNVVLILSWGLEPLWVLALVPPVLFVTGLTYLVFSTEFLADRT